MKKIQIFHNVLKRTGAYSILTGYGIFFLLDALIILVFEPNIHTYGEALWYCYAVFSTVGFGDLVSVTMVGRIVSIILTIATIFVVAVITGAVAAFYNDVVSIKYKASKAEILHKLERLPELSKEELTEISEKIKKLT